MTPYPRCSSFFVTLFASIFGTMIPMTFFVLRSRVGTSREAKAADFTPMDPSMARAIAIRCSATRDFSARFERRVFARSRTRKNSTMRASRLSFSKRWPRSAIRRVRRSWRSWDRVGLYCARTILRGHLRLPAPRGVVRLEDLPVDLREPCLVDRREELPADLEGLLDRAVLLVPLADELLLEAVRELEHLPVPLGEGLLPDDRHEASGVLAFRVGGVELVGHLFVILPSPTLPDPRVHEPRKGGQRVDGREDALTMQLAVHGDLALRDVSREVRDGVGPVVVRDRHDRDLRDAPRLPADPARALVHRGEIRVHVPGVSAAARDLLPGGPDLSEGLRVVRHVREDDEDGHADLIGEVLRRRQGHPGGDEPLYGGVVGEVQEQDRALEGPRALEVVHEHAGLLVGDSHRGEDDPEGLLAPEDLRLARDLEGDLVMGQPGAREQGELLPAHEGIEPVNRRDPRLDELRRVLPGVGVDRRARDRHALLGDDRRAAVRGLARAREDAPEHVPRHGELDCLPEELHARRAVDPRGPLEDLDDDDLPRGVEDLPPLSRAIGKADLNELVVAHGLRLLDEDEGARNGRDRPVLLRHQRTSSFLKSSSMRASAFSSSASNFSSYFTRVRSSRDLRPATSLRGTSRATAFPPRSAYLLIDEMSLNCRSGGQNVSTGWYAFCCRKISRIIRATSRVSCCSGGSAPAPTSRTISSSSASSWRVRWVHCRSFGQSSFTFVRKYSSRVWTYRLYDVSQLIAGKCRRARSAVSRAQNTFTIRRVPWVTGSEKSPPLGDTAPTTLTDPSRPLRVFARPARSYNSERRALKNAGNPSSPGISSSRLEISRIASAHRDVESAMRATLYPMSR